MLDRPSLTIRRRLAAPPERVYAAWTRPEHLLHWFGPPGIVMLQAEADARVGGRYRLVGRTPDGEINDVGGTYVEVVPDRRLVFTWAWHTTPERESLVTIDLAPDGDGTMMVLTHERFFDEAARDRHQVGWTGSLDRLATYLG